MFKIPFKGSYSIGITESIDYESDKESLFGGIECCNDSGQQSNSERRAEMGQFFKRAKSIKILSGSFVLM